MSFEAKNAYYWTEKQIDELSIQDQIDRKKLEINQLTKENLKKLKVDILHSNSHLRVRDENWKIIWKLKDNQVVDFNGEKKVVKYKNTQKVFLWINYKKWDKIVKAFISADYVKGNITKVETSNKTEETIPTKQEAKVTPKKTEEVAENWNEEETTTEEAEEIIQTREFVIKRTKRWVIMPWEDWHEYIINPTIDRRFLEKEAKARFDSVADVLETWTYNAHKVAENDAFWDSTKNNIHSAANKISELLNNAENSVFQDEKKYREFINKIFNEIIKTEDDERDIIDEEDMKEVKKKLLEINSTNQKEKILEIYNLMRVWIAPWDDGDTTIIKEKLSNKLINSPKFNFVKQIEDRILNSKKTIHIDDIDSLLNDIEIPKVDRLNQEEFKQLIKEKLQTIINWLDKSYIWSEAENILKKWYEKFCTTYNVDKSKFSLKDYETMQKNSTFARIAKHTILRYTLEASYDRWDEDKSISGMYADMVWLSESGDNFWRADYIDIADENIDYVEEIAATVATSLIPWWIAYAWARWAFTAYKASRWIKEFNMAVKWAEFLTRWTAWYIWSELYSSAKDKEWHWTYKWWWEFLALDWVLSFAWKAAKFINGRKQIGKLDFRGKKMRIAWYWVTTLISTEAMVNIPRVLEWKEIELNPANWTKEDITLILMMVAMHASWKAGELLWNKVKATKWENWDIKIEWSEKIPEWFNKLKPRKGQKIEWASTKETILPRNEKLEITGKNWDQYEVTTNDTWSIIKVFNITKNLEIKWWARSSWIKYNLENIKQKYWVETAETQTSSKQAQTEENSKTKEKSTEKTETEKTNKKTEVNQNVSEIQKEIDWNFDKAIETELNKLKVNETINLAWNKIIKIEDNPIKKRFKVEFNWKEYKFWSLKETKDFINSNIKDNVTKLEIISKTEYKKHNKKLDKLHKKETKIVDGYKFTKEGEIINSKWEIIDFKKLPEKVKLKAVELTTWIKWMSNNIIKSTDNLNKLIKKLWGKESITTWEVCDTIYSKSIKKWKKFFETIWSENIIKKLWNLEPQWAKNFTEKDRSFLNPMKYANWVYMFTKWLWKIIINWWPNKTFENLGKSNTKMEVLKTILTWERTNKEALIAFAAMWALPIWMNIHEKWFINALEWETFKDILLNEHWRVFWPDTLNAINSFWPQSEIISNVTNSIKHWGQENTQ